MFAVADTLDALTSARPYRRAISFADARKVICDEAGTQFDPAVVAAYATVPDDAFAGIRDAFA